MSTTETSQFVRLRVELVVEVEDVEAVTGAALRRIADDPDMPADERVHAESAVTEDTAEALAYLVDPFDLVVDVPGSNSPRPPGAAKASTTTPIRRNGVSTRMMIGRTRKTDSAERLGRLMAPGGNRCPGFFRLMGRTSH